MLAGKLSTTRRSSAVWLLAFTTTMVNSIRATDPGPTCSGSANLAGRTKGVEVAVKVAVGVLVDVFVAVNVEVNVADGVVVAVLVGVCVAVWVAVLVAVNVGVELGVSPPQVPATRHSSDTTGPANPESFSSSMISSKIVGLSGPNRTSPQGP